ncbi:putative bifunctional inhibitor/plant lipid transfer protein/seed storage helical [Helianthus annuus]|nr:putative bifunctional inhibitor/plant lipid transfer protein/seed storage helical [Helianthus annuus]KAJ0882449.1 putative bifunctional inhibitor/plant lipid transfer protein/seed storage helical [Helianthus annuus]
MDRFSGLLTTIFLAITVFTVSGQISTPCTVSMIASFTPCVNYITGSSANGGSPTASCCKAVESLMTTSMDCTCLIVTGNVPFSLPSQINQALAITLPKACNSKSVPFQCKSTGVPLPPAGPALFVPPPPPPKVLPPAADSPDLPPSPSGSVTATPTPSPSEKSQDDLHESDPPESKPVVPDASTPTPTAPHGPPVGSGIRPVLTPAASTSNQLHCSPPIVLLMLAAITVMNYREVFVF